MMETTPPDRAGRLLTVLDVALLLRVDQKTVRRWIRSGALQAIFLGSRRAGYRVGKDDLDRFLEARRIAIGQPGQSISSLYQFINTGSDDWFGSISAEQHGPKTARAIQHEQHLYAMVLAREAFAHGRTSFPSPPLRPAGTDTLLAAPLTPEIERLSLSRNTDFCPYCGELTPETVRDQGTRVIGVRCKRCQQDWYGKVLPPPCHSGCQSGGNGIWLGSALEVHPLSLMRGRIRSAYGMGFCEDCGLGILYRWEASAAGPQITLIHWFTRFRWVSTTTAAKALFHA